MSLNFLVNRCQEAARKDLLFGLCDDQDGKKAYSNADSPSKWIATVKNDNAIELVFTPIDKCIIQDHEYPGRWRCDGMLTSSEHLYFVELKDEAKGWITDAVKQLESTIEFFKENHNINAFRHKKAYACNKQHSHFLEIENEFNRAFFRRHKMRIDVQADIIII
jgi:hypothetical protein